MSCFVKKLFSLLYKSFQHCQKRNSSMDTCIHRAYYYYYYYYYYKRVTGTWLIVPRNFEVKWQNKIKWCAQFWRNKCLFSIQRQSMSVWRALSSISAWILAAMEMTRQKVANCYRLVPPRLETHDHLLSSASIAIVMTSAAMFDDQSRHRESASSTRVNSADRYGGAVLCWQRKPSTARWYAIFSRTLNQLMSRRNSYVIVLPGRVDQSGGCILYGLMSVNWATRWADWQESHFSNPNVSKWWWATGELVWSPTGECCKFVEEPRNSSIQF